MFFFLGAFFGNSGWTPNFGNALRDLVNVPSVRQTKIFYLVINNQSSWPKPSILPSLKNAELDFGKHWSGVKHVEFIMLAQYYQESMALNMTPDAGIPSPIRSRSL